MSQPVPTYGGSATLDKAINTEASSEPAGKHGIIVRVTEDLVGRNSFGFRPQWALAGLAIVTAVAVPDLQAKARRRSSIRRSLGHLLDNGIWLGLHPGTPVPVMAAGEGFETMASLRTVMPALPVAAATSANHLAGLSFPPGCRRLYIAADADAAGLILPRGCRRLYIAADADAAGRHGIERLSQRASEAGILTMVLCPQLGDFNDDLRHLGPAPLAAWLRDQLVPDDAHAFLPPG